MAAGARRAATVATTVEPIVEEDRFPVIALHDAVEQVRALIERIDAASAG